MMHEHPMADLKKEILVPRDPQHPKIQGFNFRHFNFQNRKEQSDAAFV